MSKEGVWLNKTEPKFTPPPPRDSMMIHVPAEDKDALARAEALELEVGKGGTLSKYTLEQHSKQKLAAKTKEELIQEYVDSALSAEMRKEAISNLNLSKPQEKAKLLKRKAASVGVRMLAGLGSKRQKGIIEDATKADQTLQKLMARKQSPGTVVDKYDRAVYSSRAYRDKMDDLGVTTEMLHEAVNDARNKRLVIEGRVKAEVGVGVGVGVGVVPRTPLKRDGTVVI